MQQVQYIAPNRMYVFGAVTQEPGPPTLRNPAFSPVASKNASVTVFFVKC